MTLLNTTSANAITTSASTETAITVEQAKIDKDAANDALKSLTLTRRKVEGRDQLPSKKVENAAKKVANAAHRKQVALDLLTNGKAASKQWTLRYALQRVVNALKAGITEEEIRGCKALMEFPWASLEEPVRRYSVAVNADPELVVKALCSQVALVASAAPAEVAVPVVESSKSEPVDHPMDAIVAKAKPAAEVSKAPEAVEPPKVVEAPKAKPAIALPPSRKAVTGNWPSIADSAPPRKAKRAAVAPVRPAKPAKAS